MHSPQMTRVATYESSADQTNIAFGSVSGGSGLSAIQASAGSRFCECSRVGVPTTADDSLGQGALKVQREHLALS